MPVCQKVSKQARIFHGEYMSETTCPDFSYFLCMLPVVAALSSYGGLQYRFCGWRHVFP